MVIGNLSNYYRETTVNMFCLNVFLDELRRPVNIIIFDCLTLALFSRLHSSAVKLILFICNIVLVSLEHA